MKYTATRLLPALFALALVAWMPSSELIAQGRGGGAGGGAQGGAFGQGGGRQQQLPTRDQVGGNQGGDQAAGTAVIRGRVVAADSGMPVRRAQVRAQAGEIRANRLVSTDAQGRFELKDLPAGRWTLTASKAGYMTLRYGQKRSFEAGTPIEIGDGQLMERADFALPKGAAITGRIFDEYGDAVANARVQVLRSHPPAVAIKPTTPARTVSTASRPATTTSARRCVPTTARSSTTATTTRPATPRRTTRAPAA
jgi:carboxypeptidase family protein